MGASTYIYGDTNSTYSGVAFIKASAKSKLEALGLTTEEIKSLIG
jgi:hypothetical protein